MAGRGALLVSKLRFTEFAGDPIQHLQLGDATTESTERNGDGQAAAQIMGVSKVEGIVPMEERIIAADTARYKFVRKDWFAYNPMRLNIGSIARWQGDDDILVSPDYVVFKCKSSGPHRLDPVYLDHFRRYDPWEDFVSEKGDGSVRVRIYYKDLARLELALPSFPEQQKIADCLDSADALIAAQGRKVDALKAHKEGLMQQLFPRPERVENGIKIPAETQPRLRFPEFEGAGEWEPRTVGSVCTSFSGGTPNTSNPEFYGGDIPFIRSAEIGKETTELFLTRTGLENSAAKLVKKGDVLVALYGANSGDVAIGKIAGAINQAILCLRPSVNGAFLSHFLTHRKDWIITKYIQGGQGNLSGEIVKSIGLVFPSPTEQQRIADCLTSHDDLIAGATRKLNALKTHKKGLMQQLFPQIGEGDA
ncbi:restriction endonuclease subunit S [Brucella sp. BE17]|uniref:restriction endonuclease subunit S n=1 Tax=Brucella sp. BE17 TaxID=3142977 RepID=UPI0031BA091F